MPSLITSVFNITPTPFHDDGSLDLESLRRLTAFTRGKGVNGMTILGVLGEADKLTEAERDSVIATTIEGVRAYYYYTLQHEEEAKWAQGATTLAQEAKKTQWTAVRTQGSTPIDAAMQRVAAGGGGGGGRAAKGAGPATKPAGQ